MKNLFSLTLAFFISLTMSISYAEAQTYDGTSPYTTKCVYKKPHLYQKVRIYQHETRQQLGTLYLWGSTTCHTAWTQFIATFPKTSPYITYVWIVSYDQTDSFRTQYRCPRSQGTCTSPQVENQSPWKAKAELDIIDRQTNTPIGYGSTNKYTGR